MKTSSSSKVDVRCPTCGKVASRYPSQVRWRGARFCSYACRDEAGKRRRMANCKQCGVRYERASQHVGRLDAGKFCSRACWREWVAANRRRRVVLVCAICGDQFERVAAWARKNSGAVYCSKICQGMGRRRFGSERGRGRGWAALAESIRERDGRRCVRCGDPEHVGTRQPVDHIVPWVMLKHRPELANDPDNLVTLCLACHGVKTSSIEPRLLGGDFVSLLEFLGRPVMEAAMARLAAVGEPANVLADPAFPRVAP